MSNMIKIAFDDAKLAAVDSAITEVEKGFSELIALSPRERKSLKRMGEKSESFCRQALHVVGQNPQIVPPNVPVADAIADLKTLDQLRPRLVRLAQLVERASDTDAALGNDIMAVSLHAYGLLKLTGSSEGLGSLRKDLGTRFAKGPRQAEAKPA